MTEEAVPAAGELPLEDAKAKPFTTSDLMQMLWNKYTEKGSYVVLFDVPNIVGLQQERRCDAVAIGMWGSTGRLIHGFELKASRNDWLRELKQVTKADPFIEQCDRWWLVTADTAIAKPEEIPAAWGWMTATRSGLRVQRPAAQLPQDETRIRRLWAFALIRRAAERKDEGSAEFKAAIERNRVEAEARAEREIERRVASFAPELQRLQERVAEFEKASGMKLEDWRFGNVGKLARRLAALKEDGYGGFGKTLHSQIQALEDLARRSREALDALADPALTGDEG